MLREFNGFFIIKQNREALTYLLNGPTNLKLPVGDGCIIAHL